MIFRNRRRQIDKMVHPIIGLALFFVSIVLLCITAPLGILYGTLYSLFTKRFAGVGEFALKIAISVDQLGNVSMQHLLNKIWLKQGSYRFGNRDETISSVLGRNKNLKLLTGFGRFIDKFLDVLDPDHSLNSIDYYVEPSSQILEKIGWIYIKDSRILCIKAAANAKYSIPGATAVPGETHAAILEKELYKRLNIHLLPGSLLSLGIFEGKSGASLDYPLVRLYCYEASFTGALLPKSDVSEIVWLHYRDKKLVYDADALVFDYLKEKELIL